MMVCPQGADLVEAAASRDGRPYRGPNRGPYRGAVPVGAHHVTVFPQVAMNGA